MENKKPKKLGEPKLPELGENEHKKSHKKSNSNVEDLSLKDSTKLEERLHNFVNNYDELITGFKNIKTKSTDKILSINPKQSNTTQSAVQIRKETKIDNLVSQVTPSPTEVAEKYDIQNLTNIEEIKDFYDYTENCLLLISKLSVPDPKEIESLKIDLPEPLTKKRLAIFDLDETLIHCELKNISKAEKIITIKLPNGNKARVGLNIRPQIVPALEQIKKDYNMIIFTASDKSYADSVVNYIDPFGTYFKYRLYRSNCVKVSTENGPVYVKDLRVIRNVPLSNMVLIDNSVLSFAFHLENGIPILPFYSNKDDNEMESLKNYLTKLSKYDNIVEYNSNMFNLKSLMNEASTESINDIQEEEKMIVPIQLTTSNSKQNSGNKKQIMRASTMVKEKTNNELVRTKKQDNLENENKLYKPTRRKSKLQTKIFETLENVKKEGLN